MDKKETRKAPCILIVDDAEVNVTILRAMIESLGYIAMTANSVKEALELMENQMPQLILSDVAMPETDGYEFCMMLKGSPLTRDIPVIFISGMDSGNDKIKGFEVGGIDFISKPFEAAEVAVRLNTHLKIHEMQHQLELYNKQLNLTIEEQLNRIEEEQKHVLFALAKVTEGGGETTGYSHLENVAYNARVLAQSISFSPKFENVISQSFIDVIGIASMLHDIGKIAIPDYILLKRGILTNDERKLMQTHTEKGGAILEEIHNDCGDNRFVQMAIDIAKYHHERWDGSGYPFGLKSEEIPISARIVGIVGVFDTLVHEQYYKDPKPQIEAIEAMSKEVGTHFDPDIFDVFLKVINQMKV